MIFKTARILIRLARGSSAKTSRVNIYAFWQTLNQTGYNSFGNEARHLYNSKETEL